MPQALKIELAGQLFDELREDGFISELPEDEVSTYRDLFVQKILDLN